MSITDLKTGNAFQITIPPQTQPAPHPQFTRFVENLALIQKKTGKALRIPDFQSLTYGQMKEAQEMASIVTTGRHTRTSGYFELNILRPGLAILKNDIPREGALYLRISYDYVNYDLLSEHFELGPCVTTVRGKLANSYEELSTWYEHVGDEDSYKLRLLSPEISDEYQNWLDLPSKN